MDTSETYIKMCGKAEKIQSQKAEAYWQEGDTYYSPSAKSTFMFTTGLGDAAHSHLEGEIWLPRQDQLQEMVNWSDYDLRFSQGTHSPDKEKPDEWEPAFFLQIDYDEGNLLVGYSMEQLWMAFVQKELWNKTWTGEKWE